MNARLRTVLAASATAALLLGTASTVVAAPTGDVALRFGAPIRTVVDMGTPGTSVGDITVTSGDVRRSAEGPVVGTYATNQVTVRADAASGREIRKVDLSIRLKDGDVFGTALIRAQVGTPPTQRMTFAITGGTGTYAGAQGTITHEGVAGKPEFAVRLRLLP